MELSNIIKKYGEGNEKSVMIEITSHISDFIKPMKDTNTREYWKLMRMVYGTLSGQHYDKEFAEHDVSQIEYTGKDGKKHTGAYWTCEQIEEATRGMQFPSGVTRWDKYVAFNAMKSDLCNSFDDDQIIKAAYDFYFMDEDWDNISVKSGSPTKVWDYFYCKYGC